MTKIRIKRMRYPKVRIRDSCHIKPEGICKHGRFASVLCMQVHV